MRKIYFYMEKMGPIVDLKMIERLENVDKSKLKQVGTSLLNKICNGIIIIPKLEQINSGAVVVKESGLIDVLLCKFDSKFFFKNILEVTYNEMNNEVIDYKLLVDSIGKRIDFEIAHYINQDMLVKGKIIESFARKYS